MNLHSVICFHSIKLLDLEIWEFHSSDIFFYGNIVLQCHFYMVFKEENCKALSIKQ